MKVSLCMISGNEAAIIERCLESAKGAFDELCLVQAVGDRDGDNTPWIAEQWCERNGKEYRFQKYRNGKPFPHVDNFAAARNASFDLATGDWLLWLDCDDYLDDINCRRIREAVTIAEHDALFCTYKVEREGAEILRERLIKRGKGRWRSPIHETCTIDGTAAECPQIVVYHSDHKAKNQSSALRNSAILEASLEDAPRHYFYLHADLKLVGKKEEATKAALAALQLLGDHSVEEKYLVLLNLSELQPDKRQDHLHAALRLQPHRREALAYLCQVALNEGRLSDAISFFRMMDALPMPSPAPWTHQTIWYGWARNFLRVRILRESGQTELAESEHQKHLADKDYAEGVARFEAK
jgi:tetratricopeptide (TPR) repeat protein